MASPHLGCQDPNLEMSCGGCAVWREEEETHLSGARPGGRLPECRTLVPTPAHTASAWPFSPK